MKGIGVGLCVVVFAMSVATAQIETVLEDFESGNGFSGGTVVADPGNPTNNVLYVDGGVVTLDLAVPLEAGESISIRVYDHGKSAMDDPAGGIPAADSRPAGSKYGWNLGVSGTYHWGVALVNKSFLGANAGYGWTDAYYDAWPQSATSLWSMGWFGGPRQVGALSVIGGGTIGDPEVPGQGAWSTWTFTLNADGSMTLANDGIVHDPAYTAGADETAITQIYVASHSTDLGGVWIDDVRRIGGVTPPIPGDFDFDGDVDLDDFVIGKNSIGTVSFDLDDLVGLKENFGTNWSPCHGDKPLGPLSLHIAPNGTCTIVNDGTAPFTFFDGYAILSPGGSIANHQAWMTITEQYMSGGLNPADIGQSVSEICAWAAMADDARLISEGHLDAVARVAPGFCLDLGRPFLGAPQDDLFFLYVNASTWESYEGPIIVSDRLPGDADGDGDVDLDDFAILKSNFGMSSGATWEKGDFDGEGDVDLDDFVILKYNFGATRP